MSRTIIAGPRYFTGFLYLTQQLEQHLSEPTEIISGHAVGVDTMAITYAKEHPQHQLKVFEVTTDQWRTYGKSAGMRRNREMAEYAKAAPDGIGRLIAFWDDLVDFSTVEHSGTKNMIEISRKQFGLETTIIPFSPNLLYPKLKLTEADYRRRLTVPVDRKPMSYLLTDQLGQTIATDYTRIVIGNRGPYVEIEEAAINLDLLSLHPRHQGRCNNLSNYFYLWYIVQGSFIKVYKQLRRVDYADYVPGKFYISPFELYYQQQPLITKKEQGK